MSDENKKLDADENIAAEEKSDTAKKTTAASKKVKEKNTADSEKDDNKKKIVEKLQAMGVMSGGQNKVAEKNDPEKGRFTTKLIASAVVAIMAGSFVWALNKKSADDLVVSNSDIVPSAHPASIQPRPRQPYSNNQYNKVLQERLYKRQEQYQKWIQQQQQAQEQQRIQQQKWMQQGQQTQAKQQPTQEQYRAQQQQWVQQQQQAQAQQRAQQQKWAEQQRQAQEQQRAQQQKWAQQQHVQPQPYYAYPPNTGYPAQSALGSNSYVPGYQHPAPYYGRQY